MDEFHVIGPPGTGKTTFISKEVGKAAKKYGSEKVMVTSLTRSAASEIGARDMSVNSDQIGTLHGFAYRSLGGPALSEKKDVIETWNSENPIYRRSIPGGSSNEDGGFNNTHWGDKYFNDLSVARARMTPIKSLRGGLQSFEEKWTKFKEENEVMDFTDLIERAALDVFSAPGKPSAIFVDEAQDHDRLELSLIKTWSNSDRDVDRLVIVGDPDQNLFEWRGSDPKAFFEGNYEQLVLSQSWRLPRVVHKKATSLIERIPGRDPVEYYPRAEEGSVQLGNVSLRQPEGILRHIEPYLDEGKSVMILVTCGYMLNGLCSVMREAGIPFHNEYAKNKSEWNPLSPLVRGVSSVERFKAYIRTLMEPTVPFPWSIHDVQMWSGLQANVLRRGARKQMEEELYPEETAFELKHLEKYFDPKCDPMRAYEIQDQKTDWLERNLKANPRIGYALKVFKKTGVEALFEKPKITVGTIHSVKGGEADVVLLFPDISRDGMNSLRTSEGRSATIRQFYVGMTRARETLILGAAQSRQAVQL